jgi:hypothetical protein
MRRSKSLGMKLGTTSPATLVPPCGMSSIEMGCLIGQAILAPIIPSILGHSQVSQS